MELKIFGCRVKIDFLFILMLSACALMSAYDLLYILLYSSLHELGHLTALILCGGKADKIILSYYGVALKYESKLSIVRELIVLLAGPLVNLILFFIFRDNFNPVIFALNILPIYPLDGGRALRLFSFSLSRKIGFVFIFLIIALAVYFVAVYKSFSLLFVAVYLIIYSINY